jgi:hypothetical protein
VFKPFSNHFNVGLLNGLNELPALCGLNAEPILESIAEEIQREDGEHEGDAWIGGEVGRDEEKLSSFIQH